MSPYPAQAILNLGRTTLVSAFVLCATLLYDLGWEVPDRHLTILRLLYLIAVCTHLFGLIGLLWLDRKNFFSRRQLIVQTVINTGILIVLWTRKAVFLSDHLFTTHQVNTFLTAVLVTITFVSYFSKWVARLTGKGKKTLPPSLLFLLTLVSLSLVGSLLLKMPNCTYEKGIPYMDSLFVSASASCVTGLSTVNVPETFTPFGMLVLIIIVQLGGFGIMSFAYFVATVLGQGFSLKDKVMIRDLLSEETVNSATSFLKGIILFTITAELIGAVILWLSWRDVAELIPGNLPLFWHALFHSITSFCNAGFSTLPDGMATEFLVHNRISQTAIMILIITGGFGYAIFKEMGAHIKRRFTRKHHLNKFRWTTHFTLATRTSFILIGAGTLIIFLMIILQGNSEAPWHQVLWESLFNSVSSRTAGVRINSIEAYSPAIALFMCGLMMIGGSPGGTAGGVRTTTFAVILGEIWRVLKERQDVEFNGRRIAREVVERSFAVVVISVGWVGTATILSTFMEPGLEPLDLFFENVSAFTTTGFSRELTPYLHSQTKFLMILNMIAGRVGVFFFLVALVGRPSPKPFRYPSTKLPLN